MHEVFFGQVFCHYHSAVFEPVVPPNERLDDDCWRGQRNGLCGTAVPAYISFTFGRHTGHVNLRILRSEVPPELDPKWEEVVECPFQIDRTVDLVVKDFNGDPYGSPITFQPGNYRVRYCALSFGPEEPCPTGQSHASESAEEPEDYELTIWPSTVLLRDEVVRVTSAEAAFWHKSRREENRISES